MYFQKKEEEEKTKSPSNQSEIHNDKSTTSGDGT
jgi:hypothetical protein